MRRSDKAISDVAEMEEILGRVTVGYLGLCDGEAPYVVPVNFVGLDGRIYFHGAAQGRKMAIILGRGPNRPVAFTVAQSAGFTVGEGACNTGTRYRSVMIRGTARLVQDDGEKLRALTGLLAKCVPEGGFRPLTLELAAGYRSRRGSTTAVVAIEIEEMTGKKDGWEDQHYAPDDSLGE